MRSKQAGKIDVSRYPPSLSPAILNTHFGTATDAVSMGIRAKKYCSALASLGCRGGLGARRGRFIGVKRLRKCVNDRNSNTSFHRSSMHVWRISRKQPTSKCKGMAGRQLKGIAGREQRRKERTSFGINTSTVRRSITAYDKTHNFKYSIRKHLTRTAKYAVAVAMAFEKESDAPAHFYTQQRDEIYVAIISFVPIDRFPHPIEKAVATRSRGTSL